MMAVLTLTVIGPSDLAPDDRIRTLRDGRLRIGRDADNDWIIADPERLISRHHCTIMASGGLFTVIDTSVNGLVINDAERPLGRGNSALLGDGDVLHLAGVEVTVALGEAHDQDRDPLRGVLPPRKGVSGIVPTLDPVPAAASAAPVLPMSSGFPFVPRVTEPPPWLHSTGSSETGATRSAAPVTPHDHVPSEHEAFVPSRVSPQVIPDDWDAELKHIPVSPPAPLQDGHEPAGDVHALTLALIEALARIACASGEEGAELFQGPPDAILCRLQAGDHGWTSLRLASLSATIAARLSRSSAGTEGRDTAHPTGIDRAAEGEIAP
ncbi:FHA domain-containing protein [Aquabacter sp. L1I39]|uniref:FHA domain-containing protein n=1 Tax=Aquabacter sp. L1I39 TaxID=2820278 RepID=UPI001AD979C9|nr:FHA domain-containing protein [Aquabacter sp. L1I39]QTL01709.1 FHA domain-containing protein [Aquabacter sp. L1I39]